MGLSDLSHGLRRRVGATTKCVVGVFPGLRSAVAVCTLSAAELVILALHGSGFWDNEGLSSLNQLGLASLSLLSWSVIIWGGYWYLCLIQLVRCHITNRGARRTFNVVAITPIIVCVNLYLSCWLFFWKIGVFPDRDSLYFAVINCNMLAKYFWQAERGTWISLITVMAAITVATFLAGLWILNRFAHVRPANYHRLVIGHTCVLLVLLNATMLVNDLSRPSDQQSHMPKTHIEAAKHPWAPYTFELQYHVNPSLAMYFQIGSDPENAIKGEIPPEALAPRGSIRPSTYTDIERDRRYHIILITIESLRSDAILMKHQGQAVMPNLAELARTGHFFPKCYANSTHSDYSDPCIVSSLYPLRSVRKHYYRREDPWPKVLIFDLLKQYGYATAVMSSQNETWSNMHLFYESPNLDVFFDSRSASESSIVEKSSFEKWMSDTGQIAGKLDDAFTVKHAIQWIRNFQENRTAFVLSMNLQTSHFPYHRPDGEVGPFLPGEVPPGTSFITDTRENIVTIRNAYYNALRYVDSQIGRLVESLNENGMRDHTIIIVTGDHGEAFFENGIFGHAAEPLETVLKVGLIINCPNYVDPAVDQYIAQSVDIVPTAVGLLGVPPHPAFQGVDLLDSYRPELHDRLIYVHCRSALSQTDAVISGTGWKYVFDHFSKHGELYYQPTDLVKHRNLVDSHRDVAGLLHSSVAEWRRLQLLYYQNPRYYNWFYPPRMTVLSDKDRSLLERRARSVKKE